MYKTGESMEEYRNPNNLYFAKPSLKADLLSILDSKGRFWVECHLERY